MDENKEAAFLEHIIKNIVDKPDSVQVTQTLDNLGIKLTLKVDASDMSKVIGSQGKTANALRTIIHAYGGKHESRIGLIIEEPNGGTGERAVQ